MSSTMNDLAQVKPCREEVARAIRLAGDTGNNSARLIAESERQADAILALFDTQPTVAEVRADEAPMSTETALPAGDLVRGWDQGYAAAVADVAEGTRTLNPHRSALLDEMARIPAQSETDALPRCPREECEAGYHHWHYKSDGMPSSRVDLDLHLCRDEFEHQETDDCTRCYGPRVVR